MLQNGGWRRDVCRERVMIYFVAFCMGYAGGERKHETKGRKRRRQGRKSKSKGCKGLPSPFEKRALRWRGWKFCGSTYDAAAQAPLSSVITPADTLEIPRVAVI